MHLHLQRNGNRLAAQRSRLIFPLQYGVQSRFEQQRMSVHRARLHEIPVFIDLRFHDHRAPNVRFSCEWRVRRIHGVCQARRFDM